MSPSVLHIAQPTDAGVARWIADHSLRQAAAGWTVHVACGPASWLAEAARGAGAAIHDWPASRSPVRGVVGECREIRRIVERVRPDLVHLHSSKAGLDGRLALRGRVPTVFSPHAWSFDAVSGPVASAARSWERVAARWTTLLLTVSVEERRRGEACGISCRTAVVANGIDLTHNRPANSGARLQARRSLGLGREAPLAVCVGRLSPQKGQDLLLDVWPQVQARVRGAELAFVGDGPDMDRIRARATTGVRVVGQVADPRQWYAAATVVVVPSRWEGMAFVPLEAMAAARAVVAFATTGIRESVPDDAGSIVPPGNLLALGEAISGVLAEPHAADRQGRRGRKHVEDHHDLIAVSGEVLQIYQDLVTEQRGAAPPAAGRRTTPSTR